MMKPPGHSAPPEEPTSDISAKPVKARSSRHLIGLFRPTAEQLASDEELDKLAEQMAEFIQQEVARLRSSAEKTQEKD